MYSCTDMKSQITKRLDVSLCNNHCSRFLKAYYNTDKACVYQTKRSVLPSKTVQ